VKALSTSNYEVIGLDWTIDPKEARKLAGGKVLQGNLDPCALYAPKQALDEMAAEMVSDFGFKDGPRKGWIGNLGHGIYKDTDEEHLRAFLMAVQKHSSAQK